MACEQPSLAFISAQCFKARFVPFVFCAKRRAVKKLVVGGKLAVAPVAVRRRFVTVPKLASAAVPVRVISHA